MQHNRRKRSASEDSSGSPDGKGSRKGSMALEPFIPDAKRDRYARFNDFIHRMLFPNLPEQYPFRKKLQISKNTTRIGLAYDIIQDFCSVLMCAVFVASTYYKSYTAVHTIYFIDMSISVFVLVDILFNTYLTGMTFVSDIRCIVDMLAIFPTFFVTFYVLLWGRKLSIFYTQLISTLRLIRVVRIFKTLRFYHSMRKAVLKLAMSLICFIFICSGLFQFFENDVPQRQYDCQYINEDTDWRPSCSEVMPASEMSDCDCDSYSCEPLYDLIDSQNKPSQIMCQLLDFNDAIYFVVITVTLVGYGSSVYSFYSKVVLVALIILALITIPPQLNDVEKYMTAKTSFKNPYQPSTGEYHVIVCGHVNDKKKLSAFLKEFLHPDRMFSSSPQFHVVIMSTSEPNEDVMELLQSEFLEGRITYCIGSALVQKDLERVRVDLAFGMFFLCNTELDASSEVSEDTATVMRALSVSNFNPSTECFVQVLKADERKILKDSDVDVILCLDEYKITLQAKNSICPGFSTMIENLFHSFGGISSAVENELDPWYHEYLHGARMELYYVPLDLAFMKYIDFSFAILTEAIYTEWNLIVMGVCTEGQDEILFNPISKKTKKSERFESLEDFYSHFNTAVIIADDNLQAEEVGKGLNDSTRYKNILKKMKTAEVNFPVRISNAQSQAPVTASAPNTLKHNTLRSALLLKSLTKARDSLSKALVSSPTKQVINKELAPDVQRVHSENYDSDESADESTYIGYASTRERELLAALAALTKTGYSDDGDKGFGRTSMVYTRHRTGLDVHARAIGDVNGANGQNGLDKSKKLRLKSREGALSKFSSKAMARGRKISMALNIRGRGPAPVLTTSVTTPDKTPAENTPADKTPDENTPADKTQVTPHKVVSNTTTGEVRKTFTLTPSQMIHQKLHKFDEGDEDEDDDDDDVDAKGDSEQRLGTFKICEDDEDEDEDNDNSDDERKEERKTPVVSDKKPTKDSSVPVKTKHTTWGTLRESVVKNSPSQMLLNWKDDHSPDDSDDDVSPPTSLRHVAQVVDCVMDRGKKITNIQITDVLKAQEDNVNENHTNNNTNHMVQKDKIIDESPVKSVPQRAPRRSVLRRDLPSDDKQLVTSMNKGVTNSSEINESSTVGSDEAVVGQKPKIMSPSQMMQSHSELDDGEEDDEDEENEESEKQSPPPPSQISSPPIANVRKSVIQFSPSQMLKRGDANDDSDAEDDDDDDEDEDECDNRDKEEESKKQSVTMSSPPIANVRKSVIQFSPSQMLKRGDANYDSDAEDDDDDDEDGGDNFEEPAVEKQHPNIPSSSPPEKTARAPRRSVLRKNISSDNVHVATSANSASVVVKNPSPSSSSHPLDKVASPHRKKLPPLSSTGSDVKKSSDKPSKSKAFRGKSAAIGPETTTTVKGPSADLITLSATKKKKRFRLKKMISKLTRSNRVAILCEPGAMSPTFDAVVSQLKTRQAQQQEKISKAMTKSVPTSATALGAISAFNTSKKDIIKSNFKKNILRASMLQKQRDDSEKKENSSTETPPAEEEAPRKSSAFGGFASVVKKALLSTHPDSKGGLYGRQSEQITDASFLSNHIVIFGNVAISHIFISELRRPTVRDDAYHPILLVDTEKPKNWDNVVLQYNDVYFLPGSLLRSRGFGKSNIEKSFAVILLNMRSELNLNENIDSQTLFSYLKLEQYIPRNVFFSVELSNPANMSVLNATLMRRVRTHGTDDTRICLRSHLETLSDTNAVQATTLSTSGVTNASSLALTNGPPQPESSYHSSSKKKSVDSKPTPKPPSPVKSVYPPIPSPTKKTSVAEAVSVANMVMLSSGSSSCSDDDDDDDNDGNDKHADEIRKQNIANFRAQMKQKKQESELAMGGFSSNRRRSTRHTAVMRNPDSIPKAARGSVSRVHNRGTVVQSRKTMSNFRAPEEDLSKEDSEADDEQEEEERKPSGKEEPLKEIVNNDDDFWNATDTHHMLPVFAAGRAYVPSSFESLLVQSFFGVLTPMMCEIFVCGQSGQSVVQTLVPEKLFGRTFLDMFRIFSYHQVLCIGLYRAPKGDTMSTLPYVYLSPPKSAQLFYEDRVFLYGKPSRIARALAACNNNNWR